MRIDNNMAGYRPPPPKSKNKGLGSTKLNVNIALSPSSVRSILPDDNSDYPQDEFSRNSPRQKVHRREKIEKAAYLLSTQGNL